MPEYLDSNSNSIFYYASSSFMPFPFCATEDTDYTKPKHASCGFYEECSKDHARVYLEEGLYVYMSK